MDLFRTKLRESGLVVLNVIRGHIETDAVVDVIPSHEECQRRTASGFAGEIRFQHGDGRISCVN